MITLRPVDLATDEEGRVGEAWLRAQIEDRVEVTAVPRANRTPQDDIAYQIVVLVRRATILAAIAEARAEATRTASYNPDTVVVEPPSPGALFAAGKARFASVLRELDAEAARLPSDLRAALWDWLLEQAGERLVKAGGEP